MFALLLSGDKAVCLAPAAQPRAMHHAVSARERERARKEPVGCGNEVWAPGGAHHQGWFARRPAFELNRPERWLFFLPIRGNLS